MLTAVWVTYLLVFLGTLIKRKEPHIFVGNWFFLAFIVTIAVLHLGNNATVPVSIFGSKSYIVWAGGRLALSSRHPLATALALSTGSKSPFEGAVEEPGEGVSVCVDGATMRLGRPSFCDAEDKAAALAARYPGASTLAFSNGVETTVFAIRQQLRPDAKVIVQSLIRKGFTIEILSGDREDAVSPIAEDLKIQSWRGKLKPKDKIAHIEALKGQGRKGLMVGDGLNDAPALAAAHVSLSPITAAHLSQVASDGVFLGDRLAPVWSAVAIARKARRIMRANLWLAVVYNAIAVPIAMAGYATPLVAALAMSGSSVLVSANALRARLPGKEGA